MKLLKRFSLLTILVVLIPVAAQAQDVPDERFSLQDLSESEGKFGVQFFEGTTKITKPSVLFAYKANDFSDVIKVCKSISEPGCATAPKLGFDAHMAACSSKTDMDCIESVYVKVNQETLTTLGEFQAAIPADHPNFFPADSKSGLPQGASSGIWRIPGIVHEGGTDEYAVVAVQSGFLTRQNGKFKRSDRAMGAFTNPEIKVAIYPITRLMDPSVAKTSVSVSKENPAERSLSYTFRSGSTSGGCALVDDGICALRNGFPKNTEFGVKVRLSKSVNGWVHGRIDQPQIELTKSGETTVLSISGLPMNVPVVSGWISPSKFTDAEKEILGPRIIRAGSWHTPDLTGVYAIKKLEVWNRLLGDRAAAYPSEWSFYSLTERELQGANSCISNSKNLAGFVSSNSTTYSSGPPEFSTRNQTLDYKIASPHYLKDGSVFEGRYNLSINSKVARCIYKFSNAPISASVSVVGGSGESRVATTAVSERKGWINLSVNGFTFSSPTVKVKLKQKK